MAEAERGNVTDELWEDFHRAVNMTSRELVEWLRTDAAGEVAEQLPDEVHEGLGQKVVAILGKRRVDLTHDDVDTMGHVVAIIDRERGDDFEPTAGDMRWRHKLMSLGHDPLRPLDERPA
jgi:hypothetical protein